MLKKKSKPKAPKARDPKFILDGGEVYISINDLIQGMRDAASKGANMDDAIGVLQVWVLARIAK